MESLSFTTSNLTELTELDLGEVAPGSSDDYALRVVNTSDTYQAEDVIVTTSGDDAIQLWLSADEENYAPSLQLGDIAPGSASGIFWLRRISASDATDQAFGVLSATPTAWSPPTDTTSSSNVALEEA